MNKLEELKAKIKDTGDYHYTAPKPCPICGAYPILKEQDLDRGNGHGYPGWFLHWYECPTCGLLKGDSYQSDIHDKTRSKDIAKKEALDNWNELSDCINDLIDRTRAKRGE